MPKLKHPLGITYYESKGSINKKTPIICLHGGPGGTSIGHRPLLGLSNDRKVYIYDQIGGGRSTPIKEEKWTIETFVKELDYLIQAWGLEQFILLGSSWGTTLALEYFRYKKGKGIKAIIFQSPMFSVKDWEVDANKLISKLPRKTQKVIKYCHEIEATDSKVYQKAVFDFYLRHVCRDEEILKSKSKIKNDHGNSIYNGMWGPSEFKATGSLKKYNQVKELRKIKAPVLFICGHYDEATPETVKRYHKLVKGSDFFVVKNASHSILRENPEPMLNKIKDFLKSI